MKHIKYITLIVALFAIMACTISDIDDVNVQTNNKGGAKISVYGQITRFDDCDVNTRANKTSEEAYVSKMALAVFPIVDGNIQNCISYGLREGSNLLFTLDRSEMDEKYANKQFAMYIFTNMPHLPEPGFTGTLDELLNLALENPGNVRPENGFPMVGSLGDSQRDGKTFVLMPMNGSRMELPTVDGIPTDYLNIPMDAIFAKVSFSINVAADQDIANNAPSMFEMTGYKINNLPTAVHFNEDLNKEGEQSVKDASVEVALSGIAKGNLESGGSIIEFDFYLPERYLDLNKTIDEVLPDALKNKGVGYYDEVVDKDQDGYRDEDEKYHQRFKPLLLGDNQKPTYITIMGVFRDHQAETYKVEYDIYLGADNYSDFNLKRNNQYINSMTIRGISSSNDQSLNGGVVAIDHRVTVTRSMPLIISFRRETLLDAHFEVRPLRVRPVGDDVPSKASVTVNVLNADGTANNRPEWVRIEASGNTADHITNDGVSKGKRKYFTTNLVTETLKDKGYSVKQDITDSNDKTKTYWVYIDENTSTASRSAVIQVSYTYNKNGENTTETQDFTIVQQGLYKVVGADSDKDYYIEQYEEYLYNYDAEDSFGQTDFEGMKWGLEGKQLSHIHDSFICNENNSDWKSYIGKNPIKYDFYIGKHDDDNADSDDTTKDGGVLHNYAGQEFTDEIAKNSNSGVTYRTMAEPAQSAVEYCYNRNKRNSDGTVDVQWFLPSADELEEIIIAGYSRFEEFQDKYYWTSQPAYKRNAFYYEYRTTRQNAWFPGDARDTYVFTVYEDNTEYARATKVVYANGTYDYAKSGLNRIPNDGEHAMDSGCVSENAISYGYFDVMYGWYRYSNTTVTKTMTTDEHFNERRGNSSTNKRYHIHLGHSVDEFFQVDENGEHGYLHRSTKARVRCVRKVN